LRNQAGPLGVDLVEVINPEGVTPKVAPSARKDEQSRKSPKNPRENGNGRTKAWG